MFASSCDGQLVLGIEIMIEAEIDLITIGKISLAAAGKCVATLPPPNPFIARGIQPIHTGGRLEVVRKRHGIEDDPLD